jgi:alkylation response protein AidB-like acyl-CoA dehydrogenase
MDLAFSDEDLTFRDEVRAFIAEAFDDEMRQRMANSKNGSIDKESQVRWLKRLYGKGWIAPDWPVEYGGTGWDLSKKYIYDMEMALAGAPSTSNMGLRMCAPVVMAFGTDAQKEQHLPKILKTDVWWCQGYSEPGSGSDLASLALKAERDGDDYVLNGSKTWTTLAQWADWMFCLVRTSNEEIRQKGISFLLLDMKSPGITIQPLRQITGEAEFNEVFLENVRVPATNVVGKVNEGWGVALTTLAYERDVLTMIRHISLRTALHRLLSLAGRTIKNGRPVSEDPVVRQKIAALAIGERVLQLNGYRSLTKILKGGAPGPEGSTSKLFWSQLDQELAELATEIIGPYSQLQAGSALAPDEGEWAFYCLLARGSGIRAGTTEILRNILGERVLGLPKD